MDLPTQRDVIDPARFHELQAALLALLAVASAAPALCGLLLDRATEAAGEIDLSDARLEGAAATAARFGSARVLNSLCRACQGCQRGVTGERIRELA